MYFSHFDHEYFCVGVIFVPILHMVDVFVSACFKKQESFCQFVTKEGRKIGSTTTVHHVYLGVVGPFECAFTRQMPLSLATRLKKALVRSIC
jgi:hypothetical protein